MSWIPVVPETEAEGQLAKLYEQSRDPATGELDNILTIHSLHPSGLAAHLGLYRSVMTSSRTLRKVERELIAVVVSQINQCHY